MNIVEGWCQLAKEIEIKINITIMEHMGGFVIAAIIAATDVTTHNLLFIKWIKLISSESHLNSVKCIYHVLVIVSVDILFKSSH